MSTLPDQPGGPRWEGQLRDDQGSEDAVLRTTDDAVVFRTATGRSGTVPRTHVSAVESQVLTETTYEGNDYRFVVGGGAVLSTLGFLGAVVTTSGVLALLLVLVGVAGLRVADYGWKNREGYEGIERIDRTVERVTVHADGGVSREFQMPAEHGVGSRLEAFVRNGDGSTSSRQQSGPVVVRTPSEVASPSAGATDHASHPSGSHDGSSDAASRRDSPTTDGESDD